MSLEYIIRESQRMQQLINSASAASQISELIQFLDAFSAINTSTGKLINEQSFTTLQILHFSNPTNIFKAAADITAVLQSSKEFERLFKQFSTPLPFTQIDFLSKISVPETNFADIFNQLSLDAHIIGEFEAEIEEDNVELTESTELGNAVQQQLATVRFLPIRVLNAIATNPELMHGLEPRDFERLIAELLDSLEFENIILTPRSNDGGRDVLATKFISGIPLLFSFECKRYAKKIGIEIMRGLLGSVVYGPTKVNKGVLVTTSTFTSCAHNFIMSEPLVDGKDFHDLVLWINEYKQRNS